MPGSTLAIEQRLQGQPLVEQNAPISPLEQAFFASALLSNAFALQFAVFAVVANALSTNLSAPQPALRPPSTYPRQEELLSEKPDLMPAPRASLVVQHTPANQPDITHSHLVPRPSPWAQQADQVEELTEGLMAIFTMGGPTTSLALTPAMRDALENKLDQIELYLSKFPALFENMKQRYNGKGPELDMQNPQQALAHRYFAWRDALEAPEFTRSPTMGG